MKIFIQDIFERELKVATLGYFRYLPPAPANDYSGMIPPFTRLEHCPAGSPNSKDQTDGASKTNTRRRIA
jgi:hypothetical protein